MSIVSIINYNILSTNLCKPCHYAEYNPRHLTKEYRWNILKRKLEAGIGNSAIFTLQEVSSEWLELLLPFFSSKKYFCIYDQFGGKPTGRMGCMICIPNIYEMQRYTVVHPGQELKHLTNNYNQISIQLKASSQYKIDEDNWVQSANRNNSSIMILLATKCGKQFIVSTYHMPCIFNHTTATAVHFTILMQKLYKFSCQNQIPLILTGDMNMMPTSPIYKIICRPLAGDPLNGEHQNVNSLNVNSLNANSLNVNSLNANPSEPNLGHLIDFDPSYIVNISTALPFRFSSAYADFNGREPLYTNSTKTSDDLEQFTATLDYIFYNGMKCLGCDAVNCTETFDLLPDALEPSDHLAIGATFIL